MQDFAESISIKSPEVRKNQSSSGKFSSVSSVRSLDIVERPLNKASINDQIQRHKSYKKRTCIPNRGQEQNMQSNVSYESYGYKSPSNEHSQFIKQKTKSKSIGSNKSDDLAINESFTIQNCCDRQSIQFQKPITPQSRLSQNTKLTASFIVGKRSSINAEQTFQQQVLKHLNSKIPEMRRSHLKIQKTIKLQNIQKRFSSTDKKRHENLPEFSILKNTSKSQNISKSNFQKNFEEKFGKQINVLMKNSAAMGINKNLVKDDKSSRNSSYDSEGNHKVKEKFRRVQNSRNVFKQGLMYHMNKLKFRRTESNIDEIDQIIQKFIKHKIQIVKYNSSIDASVQKFSNFDGYLQLDPSGKNLIITNKKPVEKPMYVLQADSNLVEEQQAKFKKQRSERFEKLKTMSQILRITELSNQPVLLEYLPGEMDGYIDENILKEEVEVNKLFQLKKSDSSCLLTDIQGFTFGGVSSRFWLMRKYFNQINFLKDRGANQNIQQEQRYDKAIEFFPWQCISLDMGHSTTFLVIKNEIVMRNFIKLLIHSLKTVDGRRGSAIHIHDEMVKTQIEETCKVWRNITLRKDQKEKISKRCWHQILTKISFKYLVQKIRGKINYLAFVKNQTILELFLRSINNSYSDFVLQGTIKPQQSFHKINILYKKITGHSLMDENEGEKTNYTSSQYSVFLLIMQMNIDLGKVHSSKLIEMLNEKTKPIKQKYVLVNKKGQKRAKKVLIDEQKHQKFSKLIKQMNDKNNCYDLFQYAQVNGKRMYEEKPVIKILRYKFEMGHWNRLYIKIRLIIQLRAVEGELYIILQLWLIQIAKKLFVLEIEQGLETFIPVELSQDHLPMCLRYYDPILNIIYLNVSEERRQYFNLQNNFHMKRIANDDKKLKLLKAIGIISDDTYLRKNLIFKHKVINEQNKPSKPTDSSHNMMLQRSKYLIIENDVNQLRKQYYLDKKAAIEMCQPHNDIVLRYCPPDEVNQRRQQFLIFMGSFLNKMNNLKFQGQQIDTMAKVEEFLEENIQHLVKKPGLQKFVKQETLKKSAKEQINQISYERLMIDILMDYALSLVLKHRKKLKAARLEEIKIKLMPENNYQDRSTYIERSINDAMKYFTHHALISESEQEKKSKHMMLHIRRMLIKQECEIVKMKRQNESQKSLTQKKKQKPFFRQ